MRFLRYIYMGMALAIAVACSEDALDEAAASRNIQLTASVGELQVNSRAAANEWTADSASLEAAVWFRKAGGAYENTPNADDTHLPVRTTVAFQKDVNNNLRASVEYVAGLDTLPLDYPADKSVVDCVGMSPVSTWGLDGNNVFSAGINGTDDLMFAPEIEGSWSKRFGEQRYDHLLAWVKINVCASSHEAIDAWGKIKQISIDSYSKVKVGPEGSVSLDASNVYEVVKPFEIVKQDGTNEWDATVRCVYEKPAGDGCWIQTINGGGFSLSSTTFTEVGSVLCFPVRHKKDGTESPRKNNGTESPRKNNDTESPEGNNDENNYWVELKVDYEVNGSEKSKTVYLQLNTIEIVTDDNGHFVSEKVNDVKNARELLGKCFVLSLYFTQYQNVIEGMCSLNPWVDQNEDIKFEKEAISNE